MIVRRRLDPRSCIPSWLACVAMLAGSACGDAPAGEKPVADANPAASEAADTGRPPFPMYLGLPPKTQRGETRITGTHARVDMGRALQGDTVQHDFVIRNDGSTPMSLDDVKACEGCILDGYSREIAAGREGRISILVLTDSNGGETVQGVVRARTSDPDRPSIAIDVRLDVAEFAAVDPYRIWLEGRVGEPIVARCIVVPNDDYPFEVTGIKARKGAWFDLAYEQTTHAGRPAWQITLTNTRTRPGPYQDVLFVQTNHPARPEFKLRVEGRIEAAP